MDGVWLARPRAVTFGLSAGMSISEGPCLTCARSSLSMPHQVVSRVSCYVVLLFGSVCTLYGAYALHYTMGIELQDAGTTLIN